MTKPTTIKPIIVAILMIENQNSNSPKSLALSRLNDINNSTQIVHLSSLEFVETEKLTYFATASYFSHTCDDNGQNQYVHPVTNPKGPICIGYIYERFNSVFCIMISKPRNINNINPIMMYV